MKQEDIQIGETYLVKVAGNLVPVQITEEHPSGKGWNGTTKAGKTIRIASVQRLQRKWNDDDGDIAKTDKPITKTTPGTTDAPKPSPRKSATTGEDQDTKPMSLIDAAAHILAQDNQEPLRCKDIVEQAIEKKLWQPGKGLTPANTLHAAITREIKTKGKDSRFAKAERGQYTTNSRGA